MKQISEYPVTFPFGATTAPYSPAHPHQGEDRAAPAGTPIIVNGVTIGLVGTTGKSSGNHLHIQKVAGGRVVNPFGAGFKLPSPVVYETGYNDAVGNYVRIRDANGVEWSYFHMSKVLSKQGDKLELEGDTMPTEQEIKYVWQQILPDPPTAADIAYYTTRPWGKLANKIIAVQNAKIAAATQSDYEPVTEQLYRKK